MNNRPLSFIDPIRNIFLFGDAHTPDVTAEEEDAEQRRRRRQRKAAAIAGAATLAALLLVASRRRRRRRKRSANASTLLVATTGRRRGTIRTSASKKGGCDNYRAAVEAPLSRLLALARSGDVQRALVNGTAVAYRVANSSSSSSGGGDGVRWLRSTLPPNSPSVASDVLSALSEGGCDDVSALPEPLSSRIAGPALASLPFVYLALLYKMMRRLQNGDDDGTFARRADGRDGTVTFDDVAGLDTCQAELAEVVAYLRNPAPYRGLGASPPRGMLLYGPPGSGKTLLARAVAGEGAADCFLSCSGSDFVEMYVGRGAARVREVFRRARSEARQNAVRRGRGGYCWWSQAGTAMDRHEHGDNATRRGPAAVVFIDEIDALAKSRAGSSTFSSFGGNDEREQTLNQLLTEMDGFDTGTEAVTTIVIAATNRPDVLDPAILRRFDRHVRVCHPDPSGREAILRVHARRVRLDGETADLAALALDEGLTGEFSGADLRNLINEAALLAVRGGSSLVEQRHLLQAARRVRRMRDNRETPSLFTMGSFLDET